jgi:hypothetical protein
VELLTITVYTKDDQNVQKIPDVTFIDRSRIPLRNPGPGLGQIQTYGGVKPVKVV